MMKISRKKVGLFITIIGCGLMLYHALSQNEAEDYQPENEYEVLYDVEYYAPHSTYRRRPACVSCNGGKNAEPYF